MAINNLAPNLAHNKRGLAEAQTDNHVLAEGKLALRKDIGSLSRDWSQGRRPTYLDGLDMLWEGINEEIPNGLPSGSDSLCLGQSTAQFLHCPLDLQEMFQSMLNVAMLIHTAGCQLLPQLAGHCCLLPHKAAKILNSLSGGGICEYSHEAKSS